MLDGSQRVFSHANSYTRTHSHIPHRERNFLFWLLKYIHPILTLEAYAYVLETRCGSSVLAVHPRWHSHHRFNCNLSPVSCHPHSVRGMLPENIQVAARAVGLPIMTKRVHMFDQSDRDRHPGDGPNLVRIKLLIHVRGDRRWAAWTILGNTNWIWPRQSSERPSFRAEREDTC